MNNNENMSLLDFLHSLPSNYRVELNFYWHSEDIEFDDEGVPTCDIDEEISQFGTIKVLLDSNFEGYGDYWENIGNVNRVTNYDNDGYFSMIKINHIKKTVEVSYIRYEC